jgi:hypothetical protein
MGSLYIDRRIPESARSRGSLLVANARRKVAEVGLVVQKRQSATCAAKGTRATPARAEANCPFSGN